MTRRNWRRNCAGIDLAYAPELGRRIPYRENRRSGPRRICPPALIRKYARSRRLARLRALSIAALTENRP